MKRFIATLSLASLTVVPATMQAQTGIQTPTMRKTDTLVRDFLSTWNIPGATVSITRLGKLIYNRAFGYADQAKTELMQPWNLQRVAGNSLPITSIAIMKLLEAGKVKLSDTVFGPGRFINDSYYTSVITDNRIYNITVQQLLEHTAGWDRSVPCDAQTSCDPVYFPLHVTSTLGESNPVKDSAMIKFLLQKGLNTIPGSRFVYSDIGYVILGKVIERASGMGYEAYVRSAILDPLGLSDIQQGKNLIAGKLEREAEYTGTATAPSSYGTGANVPWQYGGWSLEAMQAAGGWVGTTTDYTRLILSVDGTTSVPEILDLETLGYMITPSNVNSAYAKGWSVDPLGNWWHKASFEGSTSYIMKNNRGFTWAFTFNGRNDDAMFSAALDSLPVQSIFSTSNYPSHDLFAPRFNATAVQATKTGTRSARLTWTNGSGSGRVVLATEAASWRSFPVEGTAYAADGDFSNAIDLGNNVKLVYSGAGNSIDISNLDANKTYKFTVLERDSNMITGGYSVYKYGGRSEATLTMATTAINPIAGTAGQVSLYPNPAQSTVLLENSNPALNGSTGRLTDLAGRVLHTFQIAPRNEFSVAELPSGVYFLRFADGSSLKLAKR